MKMKAKEFREWGSKKITLLGMSGVGKTTLTDKLSTKKWFHFSGDYRIGTKYLEEPILDNIKRQAMDVSFLKELLLSDSIYICSNITVNNLAPISSFLGKLGCSSMGGLDLAEFKRRQALHRQAEIAAMNDVPEFIRKAEEIYGYRHFINDAGGSVCELGAPKVISSLADQTLIVYLKASDDIEHTLIERAALDPKPLYYRDVFLDENLEIYLDAHDYNSVNDIDPDDFVSWIFPILFRARAPRYEAIASDYGYTIDAHDAWRVNDEQDFLELVEGAIDRQQSRPM